MQTIISHPNYPNLEIVFNGKCYFSPKIQENLLTILEKYGRSQEEMFDKCVIEVLNKRSQNKKLRWEIKR